jgi:hypothetical protein
MKTILKIVSRFSKTTSKPPHKMASAFRTDDPLPDDDMDRLEALEEEQFNLRAPESFGQVESRVTKFGSETSNYNATAVSQRKLSGKLSLSERAFGKLFLHS